MKLRDNLIVGGTASINIINNAETTNLSALFEKDGIILKRTLGNIVNYNYNDLLNNINYNIPSIFTPGGTITTNNPNIEFSLKSQTIGTFLAAPAIGNGTPTFRRITASDLAETGVLFTEVDPFGVNNIDFTGTTTKTLTITLNNGSKKTATFDDVNSTYPPGALDLLISGTDTLDRIWSSKTISDYVNLIFQEGASKDHTHTFAELTSKPTTLSGYGITDGGISEVVSNIATGTTDVASTSNGSTFINFLQGGAVKGSVKIVGSGSTSVTHTTGGVITITGTDTNTTYTAGNGLTLSGTTFSLPITTSGTGNAVVSITQTANGITQNMGSFLPLTGGTTTGGITSPSFIKTDGTSNQFLKADGSVDSNKYLTINDIKDSYPLVDGNGINDYNNATTSGRYYITADASQQQKLNRPSDFSGVLEVTYGDDGWCFQRFTEYTSSQTVFHRRFYNGTWTEWVLSHNNLNFDFNNKSSEYTVLQNLNYSLETSKPYHQVERGFKWINGTVENFGQFNSATGSFISFGNSRHKGQLLVNKTGILFRGIYGDNDNSNWLNVWHDGNFNPDTKANVNGENTVGGVWNIDAISSPNAERENGLGQIFNYAGNTLYWGNSNINYHTIEVSDGNNVGIYSPSGGRRVVWSGHNFNPDTKANTTGNYQGLIVGKATESISWNDQIYENSENNTNPLYIMSFDQSNYRWKPTNQYTISNWLRPEINKVNPAGLKEATYGNWYGIVQEHSSDNPTNDWYNKLKILHDNSSGFSTELAQSFGNTGIFYRSTVQQTSNWTKLWDKNDFNDTRVSNWDNAYNAIGFPLSNLTTSDKTSLVGAINSVQTNVGTIKSESIVDGLGLDENKFYPVTIPITPGSHKVKIKISRQLAVDMGVPSYSTHTLGFSGSFEIITNGSGWGGYPVHQVTTNNTWMHVNSPIIINGASQIVEHSIVIIWVRGGSKYYVTVNDFNPVTPTLRREDWLWDDGSGTYTRWVRAKDINDTTDIAQSRESYLRRSGDTMYGNLDFIGADKGVAFNNTWIWRADLNSNLNLTRIGVKDDVLLVDANSLNLGVGTHNAIARITANSADSIENNSNAYAPDNTKLALLNGNVYGTLFYTDSSGHGNIQQQRVDGNAVAYTLNLNPKGGGVKIDSINRNFDGNALQVYGKVITWGREDAYVMNFANDSEINKIVAGTEYRWYNEYWKIGNRRSSSYGTLGFDFELNGVNKVSIAPNSNISTQNYGNSSEWVTAYHRTTTKNTANLNTEIDNGFYRQETPDNAYKYTTTLNLNSVDGRQQLMIDRSGAGMMFRGSPHGDATNNWSPWQHVKTGWSRVVSIHSLGSGQYVGLRLCQTNIGPMRVVVTVTANFANSNAGGGNLVKEFSFHDNGVDGFYSWNSRSLSANGSTANSYRLSDLYVTEGHISANLFGLTPASLGNPITIHIDYYPHAPNLAYDKLTPYVTGLLDYNFVMLPDIETSMNDGSNTVGGTWKINVIESPQFASSLGVGQIFNAAAGGTLYLGNPAIPLITIETTNAVDFGVYTPTGGRRQIWNGHNFDPNSKANINGDNVTPNSVWSNFSAGIKGIAAGDDAYRIVPYVIGNDNLQLEIATSDGGNEPIVVRQYHGTATTIDSAFQTINREAYLLDSSGNTSFPGTIFTSNHGESSQWKQAYNWGDHQQYGTHQTLGATYVYGGIRTPADFGAGRLKLEMVNGGPLGNGQGWNDVLWLSSYTGGDVPGSNAIIMSKQNDEIGFARQNYDSATWGTYRKIWHSGNFNPDLKLNTTGDNVVPNSKWNNYSKGIYGYLDTDFWRIQGNLVSPNNVELELATADDATESIVVRQYSGEFASKVREAYLLDSSGNTSFPGTIVTSANNVISVGSESVPILSQSNGETVLSSTTYSSYSAITLRSKGGTSSGAITLSNNILTPSIDDEVSLGNSTKRWANFYNLGTIMSIGNSNFGIRNGEGYTTAALLKATTIFFNGDLGIGSESSITFKNTASRIFSSGGILNFYADSLFSFNKPIEAPSFYETSLRKYKKNIKEYSNSALDIVKSLDVVTYDRTDSDISNKIGIIADDSHEDVLNEEKTAVDLYKTIFVLTKAIQELSDENNKLKERLKKIEDYLNL